MKRLTLSLLTILSIILSFAGSYTYNVTFDPNDLKIDYGIDGSDSVAFITSPGLYNYGEIGAAYLPVKQIQFYVPQNANNFSVTVSDLRKSTKLLDYPVSLSNCATASGDITIGDNLVPIDSSEVIAPLFKKFANVTNVSYLGGQYKIVHVNIYPSVVMADRKTLYVASSYTVDLSYNTLGEDGLYVFPSVKKNTRDGYGDYIRNKVVNGRQFKETPTVSPLTSDMQEYTHIIITPARFEKKMERLVAMRRAKGISSKVFTLEQILGDSRFAEGDKVSGICDDAGKIRAFLSYAFSIFGTRSVLFAGRYPEMPIRYVYSSEILGVAGYQDKFVPCDFYFSELNNKWKKSIYDGNYVLQNESYDIFNELEIGRINVNSETDIDNYLDKLKIYEFNPGLGSSDYLSKILHTVQDDDWKIADYYVPKYQDVYSEENSVVFRASDFKPQELTGSEVINKWNNNPVGHVNLNGHGNYGGIAVYSRSSTSFRGVVGVDNDDCWHINEVGNGLDNLNNENFPSWGYSIACGVMPYDYKIETGEDITCGYNFADAYTIAYKSGGVIFLGNTRSSFCNDGGISMQRIYADLKDKYRDLLQLDYVDAGLIQNSLIATKYNHTHEHYIRAITGDPHVPLWTLAPQRANITILDADSLDNYYNIAAESTLPDNFKLSEANLLDDAYSIAFDYKKSDIFSHKLTDNYLRTIIRKDYIPEILPLNIRNFDFWLYSTKYIFANEVNIGSDDYKAREDVLVMPSNDVTIEALSDVNVKYGLYIQSNAKLTIISDGDVYLSRFRIGDNATLKIVANHIYYDKMDIDNDGKYYLDFTERIPQANINTTLSNSKETQSYTPMVVEGRTWWYKATECFTNLEYGIRIGSEVEVGGKTYNKVSMCLNYKNVFGNTYVDPTYTWMETNEDEGLDAYIREENGKVYILFTVPERTESEKYPGQRLYGFTGWSIFTLGFQCEENVEILMYDFTRENDMITLGWEDIDGSNPYHHDFNFEMVGTSEIESYGNKFKVYDYKYSNNENRFGEIPEKVSFVEGLGLLTNEDERTHCLFYNLFPAALAAYNVTAQLRYVTEGDDNHIIFENIGGKKLWVEYAGVDNVKVDDSNAPVEYYSLQGVRVSQPAAGQFLIKKQGNTITKELVK